MKKELNWSIVHGVKSPVNYFNMIRVITKLPNSEQSYKGKVKTHNYINRQNQSTTGKLKTVTFYTNFFRVYLTFLSFYTNFFRVYLTFLSFCNTIYILIYTWFLYVLSKYHVMLKILQWNARSWDNPIL